MSAKDVKHSVAGAAPEVSKEQKLHMLRQMISIRRFEEEVKRLYCAGVITGAIHLYVGQEAVAVGACACLRDDDYATSGHRPHGHCLAKVFDLKRTMAEMLGRETGLSRGRGGSMHQFDKAKGFLGGNGIVGGGVGIALGAAFASKYRGTDQVTVCFFSDGASNQGVVHEAMNIAALWKLPVIWLCENNQIAATTTVAKSTCTPDIAPRAEAYCIPWAICDGNDVLEVYRTVGEAVARARRGEGSTFIECKTYRLEPHCGIIADERPKEELALWRSPKKDCIKRFEAVLVREKVCTPEETETMHQQVEQDLADAVEFARKSPFPAPETLYDNVWSK